MLHLLVEVDDVAEVVKLYGGLEAEHGLLVDLGTRSAGQAQVAAALLQPPKLVRLRPCKILQPHLRGGTALTPTLTGTFLLEICPSDSQ